MDAGYYMFLDDIDRNIITKNTDYIYVLFTNSLEIEYLSSLLLSIFFVLSCLLGFSICIQNDKKKIKYKQLPTV
tara:strand:- start:1044 stop:1265 length:222 start_codon:yes stop_codon:yes gene_type:complete